MPGTVRSAADEKKWKRAKKHVSDSKGYGPDSFTDQDWGLVQTIYQKIKAKSESRLNLSSIAEERVKKKRRRCDCSDGECGLCMHGWYFAPYYGKGDGQSPAAISTGPGSVGMTGMDVPSGAFPGAGGINSPSVPGGPNAGMGPITMSKALPMSKPDKAMGRSLFLEVFQTKKGA